MRCSLVLPLVACGGGATTPPDAAPGLACDLAVTPIAGLASDEPVYTPDRCAAAPRTPGPSTGCQLDLSEWRAGDPGTCATEITAGSRAQGRLVGEPIRIDGTTQLPLVVDLPEGSSDPACAELCARESGEPVVTTFGVRLRVEFPPQGGPFLSVRVEPPWFLVSGNETDPTLCHDGWPSVLEFGQPLACVFTYGHEVDVVTADPSPPPARLVIATSLESNAWSGCCLFPVE